MKTTEFQKLVNNRILFRFYLLKSLPMAFIAGIKVKKITNEKCATVIKYKWLTQNPFRSMYFACQGMAAEMSTALLLLDAVYKSNPPISTLIVQNKAVYHKKAVGKITFECTDGNNIKNAIEKARESGEAILIDALSIGKDESGDIVAEIIFTWSVKVKSSSF